MCCTKVLTPIPEQLREFTKMPLQVEVGVFTIAQQIDENNCRTEKYILYGSMHLQQFFKEKYQ